MIDLEVENASVVEQDSVDNCRRVQDAVLDVLRSAAGEGHVFLPRNMLAREAGARAEASLGDAEASIDALESSQEVVCERFDSARGGCKVGVYLKEMHDCELEVARHLRRIMEAPRAIDFADGIAAAVFAKMPVSLVRDQIAAVEAAMKAKVFVVAGGPGSGKTTVVNAIIRVFEAAKARVALVAPTGRAARRASEASGRDAMTIHRLLKHRILKGGFGKDEAHQLSCDLLVVDEASMLDVDLFRHLLRAVPSRAVLVLVGDPGQLPSIGPGNVLGDVIDSGAVSVARLLGVFRQSAESDIVKSARLIGCGRMPFIKFVRGRKTDFYFFPKDDPEDAASFMVDLVKYHIPRKFGLDPVNDIQFLAPMRGGVVGVDAMNVRLQRALNPKSPELSLGGRAFRMHDKVMQVHNDFRRNVFNGDVGRVVGISCGGYGEMFVDFRGSIKAYEFDELGDLAPSYAVSVHKAQGSEYPCVVMPVMMAHYPMLQRRLLYTAVTRAKRLVVLVGEREALQVAIKNDKSGRRFTRLAQRLADLKFH